MKVVHLKIYFSSSGFFHGKKGPGEFSFKPEELKPHEIEFLKKSKEVKALDDEAKKLLGVTTPKKELPAEDILSEKFECDRCGRTFKTQNALNAHKRTCKGASAELDRV